MLLSIFVAGAGVVLELCLGGVMGVRLAFYLHLTSFLRLWVFCLAALVS
jgi:hypothetical protein